MFKNEISSTPMTNEHANALMTNITGDRFMGDCSFISTLRALLFTRMPKEDTVCMKISRSDLSSADLASYHATDAVVRICRNNSMIGANGGFALHYFNSMSQQANKESYECVVANFESVYPGYKKLDKITEFYRKAFPVTCFLNQDTKSIALFVEQMDYRRFHYLQCAILPMVPWYFDPKNGISPLEKSLVESLMNNTPDNYNDCIRKIYDTFDFRSEIIKRELSGFELRYIKDALRDTESQYNSIINNINALNAQIGEELRKQAEITFRINGMRQKIDSGDSESEIMEYFLCNKNLTLIRSQDSRVDFIVRAKLEYFDPDMAERAVDNNNSLLYRRGDYGLSHSDMKRLYQAIFIDCTLSVNVCAAYRLSIDGGVQAIGHCNFGSDFDDCMPHPHVDEYSCMGDYVRIINELMQRHDYIMALEQCIASARSLNFADSTVLGYFASCIMGGARGERCIALPNGNVVTAPDAVKWLKEQDVSSK